MNAKRAFRNALLGGVIFVALGAASACTKPADDPSAADETPQPRILEQRASSEARAELGVDHWQHWRDRDGNAVQRYTLGFDAEGFARVMTRVRVEYDEAQQPAFLQINQISRIHGVAVERYAFKGAELSIERDDFANLPNAWGVFAVVENDFGREMSSASTVGDDTLVKSNLHVTQYPWDICLVDCAERANACWAGYKTEAAKYDCFGQENTCISICAHGDSEYANKPPCNCFAESMDKCWTKLQAVKDGRDDCLTDAISFWSWDPLLNCHFVQGRKKC